MQGIIIKGVGGKYEVLEDGTSKIHSLTLRGKFRNMKITPLPGDRVIFSSTENEPVIEEILSRKNELIRPAIANISQVFLVFALKNPDPNWDLVNSFLLMLEIKNIKPVIIFNKRDLSSTEEEDTIISNFKYTNYPVIFISALDLENPTELKALLKGEITVLAGPSGVGKSTLLNALIGEARMITGDISEKIGRGKHTTRHTELIKTEGGFIADTPGFSHVENLGFPPGELMDYFPEYKDYIGHCKYRGCNHMEEPSCKVKEMVGKTISPMRYEFYKNKFKLLKEGEKRKWD